MDTQLVNERDPNRPRDFLGIVDEALHKATGKPEAWHVDPASDAMGTWIYVDKDRSLIPSKGWKLHVSATPWSAAKVLDATLPILFSEDACFKLAASPDVLAAINEGEGGLGQIGKFMTIYPNNTDQAVSLASRIHAATERLEGPKVLTDQALVGGSLVHYRFGDFVGELEAPPTQGVRFETDGVLPGSATDVAADLDDPFVEAGVAVPVQKRLIGKRYLITSTIYRSPRGSVHLAADLIEPGSRILKRAARWGRALPDGTDARDLLRREAELLEEVAGDPRFPTPYGLIEQDDLYLVLEHVEGPTLARFVHERSEQGVALDGAELVRLGRQVAQALDLMHSMGLVYRDLNPDNVLVTATGEPRLLDLELASQVGVSSPLFAAGSPGYASPQQLEGSPAAVADDIYALGALLAFAATGHEPSGGLRLDGVDDGLAAVIESCCAIDPSERWPSMTEVIAALSGVNTETA